MLRRKNNKRGVRIAYSSETIEKKVKMGRVEFLPGISHTRVKAHVCKHDPHVCRSIPTYAKPQEQTCVSKNKAAYAASKLCIPGKPSTPKVRPIRKQKILPQWITYLQYSSVSPFILLLSEFLIPNQVMRSRRFLPIHIYSSASFHYSSGSNNQDYSYKYPLGVEHAGTVEKSRDRDGERDHGQLEARASLEKVEKEVKKTIGTGCLEKFDARA